jgi:hypothetical protein
LLLPADGSIVTEDSVTLQWAAVGTLLENERYAVTVVDKTESDERKIVEYVNDTKFIVPSSFRASGNIGHIYGWSVMTVRQTGTGDDGDPIWEPAGAASIQRVFSWTSSGPPPAVTPTP